MEKSPCIATVKPRERRPRCSALCPIRTVYGDGQATDPEAIACRPKSAPAKAPLSSQRASQGAADQDSLGTITASLQPAEAHGPTGVHAGQDGVGTEAVTSHRPK